MRDGMICVEIDSPAAVLVNEDFTEALCPYSLLFIHPLQ